MYPSTLPVAVSADLARTGAPVASLLLLATVLLLAGLYLLRTSRVLAPRAD